MRTSLADLHFLPPVFIQPDAVLDLGCYRGFSTERYARMWPLAAIHCYDLVPANLESALARVQLTGRSVAGFREGIWSHSGGAAYGGAAAGNVASLLCNPIHMDTPVPTCTLEDAVERLPDRCTRVFVKMDIEGAEVPAILDGPKGWVARVEWLLVDFHEESDALALQMVLEELGYSVGQIRGHATLWANRS